MKREVAVQWAEWLLSNPDVQGYGSLAPDDNHRCPLGVLEEMLGFSPGKRQVLGGDTLLASGMAYSVGSLSGGSNLVWLNDGERASFEKIALIIEKHSDEL